MRFSVSIIPCLAFLSLSPCAPAQSVRKFIDPVQWDGPNLVLLHKGAFSTPAGRLLDPQGRTIKAVDRPPAKDLLSSSGRMFYRDGHFLFARRSKTTTPEGEVWQSELLRHDGKTWQQVGLFKTRNVGPQMFPLKEGRILAVDGSGRLFSDRGKPMPFAVLRKKPSGEYEIDHVFDCELESPFFQITGKLSYPQLVHDFMSFEYAYTDKHLVLASQFGLFWVFDLEKGDLKRHCRIYRNMEDKHIKNNELVTGLLGFNSKQDGTILISTRMEDAVIWGTLGHPKPISGGPSGQDHKRWADDMVRKYPQVQWWEFNPETGKFTEEAPPQKIPDRLWNSEQVTNFNWRFKPDGNLEMSDMRTLQGMPAEAPEPGQGQPKGKK